MYHENQAVLNGLGARLIFAGTEKDDDSKLTVIIDFDSLEAMKAFGAHEELKAKRAAAGALLDTTVVTVMSEGAFCGIRRSGTGLASHRSKISQSLK